MILSKKETFLLVEKNPEKKSYLNAQVNEEWKKRGEMSSVYKDEEDVETQV